MLRGHFQRGGGRWGPLPGILNIPPPRRLTPGFTIRGLKVCSFSKHPGAHAGPGRHHNQACSRMFSLQISLAAVKFYLDDTFSARPPFFIMITYYLMPTRSPPPPTLYPCSPQFCSPSSVSQSTLPSPTPYIITRAPPLVCGLSLPPSRAHGPDTVTHSQPSAEPAGGWDPHEANADFVPRPRESCMSPESPLPISPLLSHLP